MPKTQKLRSTSSRSVIALILAVGAGAASAQTQPTSIQTNEGLDEVVVTAQHRSESVQNIPITVETISGAALEELGINNSTDLSAITPGLNITRANIGAVPFLRGIGNFTASPGNEAAVATYIDGVYRPSAGSSYYAFNNVERVEVLNGPQGTLFGRNAAGGVINVITKDPTQTPQLSLSAGLGSYMTTTDNLYVAGGLTDNLAADFSAYYMNQMDGWGKNLYNNTGAYYNGEVSLRSKWVWTPTAEDKVTAIGYYDRARSDAGSASNLVPGFKSQSGFTTAGGFYDIDTQFTPKAETINRGASIQETHDFSWAELTSISSYGLESAHGYITNDSCPCFLQDAQVGGRDETWSQEVRLGNGPNSKIKWEVGVFAWWDTAGQYPFVQYGTGLGATTAPQYEKFTYSHQDTRSDAAFGQVTVPVLEATDLTLGMRYTYDWRSIIGSQENAANKILASASGKTSAGSPTARVAVDHHFDDNIMAYASWNRGFKSGNYNASTPTQPPTKPETLDAYEIGLKGEFFDHRLRIDTSAFYDTFSDLQVQQQLITGNFTTNAGAARYEGIDLAVTAKPIDHLTMTLASEVLNATYTSYANASLLFPTATGKGFTQKVGDATDDSIPFAEPFSASSTAAYDFQAFGGNAIASGVLSFHHGFSSDVQQITRQQAYWISNLSLTWSTPSSHWDFKVYGDNIFNTKYYAQEQASAIGVTYSAAPPLFVGGQVTYHM